MTSICSVVNYFNVDSYLTPLLQPTTLDSRKTEDYTRSETRRAQEQLALGRAVLYAGLPLSLQEARTCGFLRVADNSVTPNSRDETLQIYDRTFRRWNIHSRVDQRSHTVYHKPRCKVAGASRGGISRRRISSWRTARRQQAKRGQQA